MHSMDAIAAMRPRPTTAVGNGRDSEGLNGYVVTPNFFQVLGASAAFGRTFREGDGIVNGASVAVLSHALWARRYGTDSTLFAGIGRKMLPELLSARSCSKVGFVGVETSVCIVPVQTRPSCMFSGARSFKVFTPSISRIDVKLLSALDPSRSV